MKTQIYNIKAEKVGEIALPKSIFDTKISEKLISQAIRVYLANQRSSYAKAKTRSDVAGTRQKVYAQKGTGRARHGNRTAPIFVGGGSAMGPDGLQNYKLNLSKKMKVVALNSILTKFAQDKKIIIIDSFEKLAPKTKEGIKLLTGLRAADEVLSKSSKVGIITTETIPNLKRAFGNLPKTNLLSLKSLNVYDLSNQNFLIFSQDTLDILSK
ncbi:MAG: 50S ribosomal protein L4 [Candidatus Shapirobacteria bacterium]|nr:50S ribosomal protein L4 [Candidatus Shapirobacteria bacterium]MDD4410708.1 50S ribosomal protein L4 [Candidatus Shapirobacteria bacterium]